MCAFSLIILFGADYLFFYTRRVVRERRVSVLAVGGVGALVVEGNLVAVVLVDEFLVVVVHVFAELFLRAFLGGLRAVQRELDHVRARNRVEVSGENHVHVLRVARVEVLQQAGHLLQLDLLVLRVPEQVRARDDEMLLRVRGAAELDDERVVLPRVEDRLLADRLVPLLLAVKEVDLKLLQQLAGGRLVADENPVVPVRDGLAQVDMPEPECVELLRVELVDLLQADDVRLEVPDLLDLQGKLRQGEVRLRESAQGRERDSQLFHSICRNFAKQRGARLTLSSLANCDTLLAEVFHILRGVHDRCEIKNKCRICRSP